MLEQFFECKDNRGIFQDYSARQIWAKDMLHDCKFVRAESDVRPHTNFRVCCSVSHNDGGPFSRASGAA